MLYKLSVAAFIVGADAFQAGAFSAPRSAVRSSSAAMQVAEAEVASPVALARVRGTHAPIARAPLCLSGPRAHARTGVKKKQRRSVGAVAAAFVCLFL